MAEAELAKNEAAILEKWKKSGGKGKPDASVEGVVEVNKSSYKKKRSSLITYSQLVPASGVEFEGGGHRGSQSGSISRPRTGSTVASTADVMPVMHAELLPRYEDRVQMLVIVKQSTTNTIKVEWKTAELEDAGGRRVHCQVWECHLPNAGGIDDEALLDVYCKSSDAIIAIAPYSEWILNCLRRNKSEDKTLVVTGSFGSTPAEAKKFALSLQAHYDAKNSVWVEVAARDVVLRRAKNRGENKNILTLMEKQLKNVEKKSKPSSGCILS